jgi:hypothetical protein
MAVRPESRLALEMAGQRFMPPSEGAEHLIDELRAGAPEAEVLFLDRPGQLDRDQILPSPPEQQAYRRRQEGVRNAPLIDGVSQLREGQGLLAELRLDPTTDPFLVEHQYQGRPILPGVVAIEAFAESATLLFPGRTVAGLREVEFHNGFRFYSERPQEAVVRATQTRAGVRCTLSADFYNRDGRLTDPQRLHVQAVLELAEVPPRLELPRPKEPGQWHAMEYLDLAEAQRRGRLYIGPPLQCIRELALERDGCWARIVAPPFGALAGSRPGAGWLVPSAVLDGCLQAGGAFLHLVYETAILPQAVARLRLGRRPRDGETCTARLFLRERHADRVCFDFTLFGEDGGVVAAADGYRCVVVPQKPASEWEGPP